MPVIVDEPNVPSSATRRAGGREARRAMRAAPLAQNVRPVRGGLEGGRYRPLAEGDLARIHEAVLTILETIGFANAIPSCIEALTRAGAEMGADGRIRFPRRLVIETIRTAARHFTLHGQDPRHDMTVQGTRVHYGTAGAAVHLVDVEKREYRESLLQDIYDAARIVDAMDNIHFFQRPMVPRDMVDPADLDLNTLYVCVAGTTKHVGTSFTVRENVVPALQMLYAIAGGEESFRARPFVSNSNCFVVPPMNSPRMRAAYWKHASKAASRSCCSRPDRPAPRLRRRSPARSFRPWRRCWPASSTSMR